MMKTRRLLAGVALLALAGCQEDYTSVEEPPPRIGGEPVQTYEEVAPEPPGLVEGDHTEGIARQDQRGADFPIEEQTPHARQLAPEPGPEAPPIGGERAIRAPETATTEEQAAAPTTEPSTTEEQAAALTTEPSTTEEQAAAPTTEPSTTEEQAAAPTTEPSTTEEQAAAPSPTTPMTEEQAAAPSTPTPTTEQQAAAPSTTTPTEQQAAAPSTPTATMEQQAAAPSTPVPTPVPTSTAEAPRSAEQAADEVQHAIAVVYGATVRVDGRELRPELGVVRFEREGDEVVVTGTLNGLSEGRHGFHVHETGSCVASDFGSAGGHFDPTGQPHAGPDASARHVGDLGNLDVGADGSVELRIRDEHLALSGPTSILGRAIVVHAQADDLQSQPSGDAGGRLACGVVGRSEGPGPVAGR